MKTRQPPTAPMFSRTPEERAEKIARAVDAHLARQGYQTPSAIERLAAVSDLTIAARLAVYEARRRELEEFFEEGLPPPGE